MTRLADVTRPVGPAFFTPIIRPRVLQRIDEAAAGQVVLMVAPAGYGKSLALSHWLDRCSRASLRFDVQAEHNTLLGFVRGMAKAFSPAVPSLLTTVGTAAQSSSSSQAPCIEMASWAAVNIENFNGVIAIDDFHRAAGDPEISRFVAALIARTKATVQWVIATRSSLDLPVASWLAYGDVHFLVGEYDLTFSEEEALELFSRSRDAISETGLRDIMEATAGWPVALSLALRSSALVGGEKNLTVATREVLYLYLAEQVYADLTSEERDLLHFAAYLPQIRVDVLEVAGYREPARSLEALRRVTFLTLESPGEYKCHDLFRDFLRRQIETKDPAQARQLQSGAAQALEGVGDAVAALRLHTRLRAADDVVRILCNVGFDLLDHAHGDVVEGALNVLSQEARSSNAILLGLRAQRESDLGHFERAENLFKRALEVASSEASRLRLAILLAIMLRNQGRDMSDLLMPLSNIGGPLEQRSELLALIAVDRALSSRNDGAFNWIETAEATCSLVESPAVRAKNLLRLGTARFGAASGKSKIISNLTESAVLAESLGLFGVASKAYLVLGMTQLFYLDGPRESLSSSTKASIAAAKSGDRFALHSALAYTITAHTCLGNEEALEPLLSELEHTSTSEARRHRAIVIYTRATMAGWHGDFKSASALMGEIEKDEYGYYAFDQIFNAATHALYAVLADSPNSSRLLANVTARLSDRSDTYPYGTEKRCIAGSFCALAELFAGRRDRGKRLLQGIAFPLSVGTASVVETVKAMVAGEDISVSIVQDSLKVACMHGHGGVSRTLESCLQRLVARPRTQVSLTPAERDVLKQLNVGYHPKEIAHLSHRSVHTIKTLIQRAIQKLGCSGTQEALIRARSAGLLQDQDFTEEARL